MNVEAMMHQNITLLRRELLPGSITGALGCEQITIQEIISEPGPKACYPEQTDTDKPGSRA